MRYAVLPSEYEITPVTLPPPVCVNKISDAPKSLPLVHHLPSMLAGAVFVRLLDDVAGVAGFLVLPGVVRVLVFEFVFYFVSVVVVLPPAG